MSRNTIWWGFAGAGVAILVGACSSENSVDPIQVPGDSGATATGVGGTTSSGAVGTTGTTTADPTGSTTATASVGGAATTTTTTTSTTATVVDTTGAATSTSGLNGSTTAGTTTTSGLGGSTSTDSTAGTAGAMACNMISGEEFFLRPTECAYCHGADGLGIDGQGPEVRHPPEEYSRWLIRNGRMDHPGYMDGMAAYDTCVVSDQMLDEILEFLNSFPQPTDGAGLYADYCANCHGADGRGGVNGIDINGEVHEVASIVPEGANTTDFAVRDMFMPGLNLTSQEIDLIIAYLQNDLGLQF